jgi:DnaJ-domain-containing protein 1
MRLPGRLRATTLGDLLGTLYRARVTGTLELVDEQMGRTHRVHVRLGRVCAVEVDGPAPHLGELLRARGAVDDHTVRRSILRAMGARKLVGEVLVGELRVDPEVVDEAVREQMRLRLDLLEKLQDARIAFRVTAKAPPGALCDRPLDAGEFLPGRRRARDRSIPAPLRVGDLRAYALLGVDTTADAQTIKRAYRRLARALHPDTHPNATPEERRDLSERFAEITAAYRRLCA